MSDLKRQTEDGGGDEGGGGRNCSSCDGGVGGGGGGAGAGDDATGCFSSSCRRPDGKVPTADPEPPPPLPPAVAGGSWKPGVGSKTDAVPGASTALDDVHDDPIVIHPTMCCCGEGDGSCFCDDIPVCCNSPLACVCPVFVPMPSSNNENQEISEEEARKRRMKYTICLISLILGIATVNLLLLLGLRFSSM